MFVAFEEFADLASLLFSVEGLSSVCQIHAERDRIPAAADRGFHKYILESLFKFEYDVRENTNSTKTTKANLPYSGARSSTYEWRSACIGKGASW